MTDQNPGKWSPQQLRTFAAVIGGGLLVAVVVTAILAGLTGVSAPKAAFVGVLVAIVGMYAALLWLGLRERRQAKQNEAQQHEAQQNQAQQNE